MYVIRGKQYQYLAIRVLSSRDIWTVNFQHPFNLSGYISWVNTNDYVHNRNVCNGNLVGRWFFNKEEDYLSFIKAWP